MNKMKLSLKLEIFASALLAIAPTAVESHGVEVHYCITPDGQNIRAFVEHWHTIDSQVLEPTDAGEMDITDNVAGTSALYFATGLVNGVDPSDLWKESRCRENFTTKVTECVDSSNPQFNTLNWVYYDFPLECDVESSYTFNTGLTYILLDGCVGQAGGSAYPAEIRGTFECGTRAPTISPSSPCGPAAGFECVEGSFVNGVGTCGDGIDVGYYPDLTNKNGYCYCTGTAAPSRYEKCPNGLHWDTLAWSYLDGNDGAGTVLGSSGYWGTIGGVCNWPGAVSAQTQQRPPWTRRRILDECEETEEPTSAPSPSPDGDSFCVQGAYVNGWGTCPDGIPDGYYPDLTNKDGYCKCTGTASPSRYEKCPNGLVWDTVSWAYLTGNDPSGFALGYGGLWATIGGVCNYENYVSDQTRDRPPYRRLLRSRA
jgi:hypothetical protein